MVVVLAGPSALAQPAAPGAPACGTAQLQPGQSAQPQLAGKGGDKTLSEHLAQSGGVICPPAEVDPAMKAPTPQTGDTPVIKPPGTPGGDQSVQPK